MLALVSDGDKPFLGGDAIELAPRVARVNSVHATPPRIVWDMSRRLGFRGLAECEDVARRAGAESPELGFHFGEHMGREHPMQPGAQDAVVVVLVPESGGFLVEVGHRAWAFVWVPRRSVYRLKVRHYLLTTRLQERRQHHLLSQRRLVLVHR